jgi:hypothetical protein
LQIVEHPENIMQQANAIAYFALIRKKKSFLTLTPGRHPRSSSPVSKKNHY